ncbi:MAG: hypothetical protein ACTHXA_10860 [Gulosibacter sp.]|uniref:hypothetical protein n=1 Tax=Gulosibacter sp. TaxID=2817531 RepID=UPI003F91EDA9
MKNARGRVRWQHQILIVLIAVSVLLVLASLMMSVLGVSYTSPIREFFDVSDERNLPTWWNAGLLLIAGSTTAAVGLARVVAKFDGKLGWLPWGGLSAMLGAMSLDEFAGFHQLLGLVWEKFVGENPLSSFGWFIIGVPLAILLVLFIWLCARQLPKESSRAFMIGIAVLLFGAIAIEAFPMLMDFGRNSTAYYLTYHVEELVEKIGASVLVVAPLYAIGLSRNGDGYTVRFERRRSDIKPSNAIA